VEVTGRQWWWEVRYPESGVVTANEIRIPAGRPVRLVVTSGDVIHSVWIPELHGKIDMIPGRSNSQVIIADEPGEYRGECAEFCGAQHAKMQFIVVAEPPERFAAWLERQAQPANAPADAMQLEGREIFLGSACVYCHAVRGTNANSNFGPDLTHLASRRTLAAGMLANNRGNLSGWVLNPQQIKPGNKMPPTALSGEELNALLAYLESLE
jgi:cytochrome c oxidase subunit 2